ncbi:MAG TPA: T9SS type A sorting domain-containing protein [Flavipsychrobacter sp.]|nr:T9SS type A sorting domain-containing protein [Flavipsychrobacter sp.]
MMKKLSLTLMSLAMAFVGLAQTPCSQLNASMTYTQSSNTVTITNTSTLPTGGTSPSSWAYAAWGDGSYGYPSPTANHTYLTNGTFTIALYQMWMDSLVGNSVFCSDTAYQTVTITTAPPPAPNCTFNISTVNNGSGSYTFTAAGATTSMTYSWTFGDGGTATGNPVTHTYVNTGSYNVMAVGTGSGCTYTDTTMVYYNGSTPTSNEISGYIVYDSAVLNNVTGPLSFKVWLIQSSYDSATNSAVLTAVDSLTTNATPWASYQFNNKAAGTYYTKAAVAPGSTNPGLIPTYHNSSAMWANANAINHTGGSSLYKTILMISGTPTSGPGFIGGNVSQGANKGTAGNIANLLILLRDASHNVIASTYTDVNGNYSFGSVAYGTYSVYPEEMNYATTPSNSMTIGGGVLSFNGVDFEKNSTTIVPKATAIKDVINNVFSIFPNPTKGLVNIHWKNGVSGNAQIIISDLSGRMVYNKNAATNAATQINLNNLNQGVYFIKINTERGQYTERVILQ